MAEDFRHFGYGRGLSDSWKYFAEDGRPDAQSGSARPRVRPGLRAAGLSSARAVERTVFRKPAWVLVEIRSLRKILCIWTLRDCNIC